MSSLKTLQRSLLCLTVLTLASNTFAAEKSAETSAETSVDEATDRAEKVQKSEAPRSDSQIVADIGNKLFFDRFFKPGDIKAEARGGVVILKGTVQNLRSKERALDIVSQVKGVISVVDQMKLVATDVPDAKIRTNVQRMLVTDPATEAFDVQIAVANGVVTLNGTVQSWAERAAAIWVAKGVTGVKDVRDQIGVKPAKNRTASAVEADIKARFRMDPWIQGLVNVKVEGNKATLSGFVPTVGAKRRAHEAALLTGINSVDASQVEVNPTMKIAEKRTDKTFTNEEVEQAIERNFLWDPRVNSFRVDASVQMGTATLTGTVDNLKAKNAALAAAQNTNGVILVVNNIKVEQKQKRADTEILKDVNWLLSVDPLVDKYAINVTVKNGVATLKGKVDSLYEKYYAGDDVSRVKGVTQVNNELEVTFTPLLLSKSDKQLEREIAQAIKLNAGLEDGEVVVVKAKNGTVELTGKVDTWVENMLAVESAFQAGAKAVLNNIRSPGKQIGPEVNYSSIPLESYNLYWVENYPIEFGEEIQSGSTSESK